MLAKDREIWYLVHVQSRGSAFKQEHRGGEDLGTLIIVFSLSLFLLMVGRGKKEQEALLR